MVGRSSARPRGTWRLALAMTMLQLAGCTPWPHVATGGGAERAGTDWQALLVVEQRYHRVAKSGGELWAPARMQEAREWLVRARREHAGSLQLDAQSSLDSAARLIDSVEHFVGRRAQRAESW